MQFSSSNESCQSMKNDILMIRWKISIVKNDHFNIYSVFLVLFFHFHAFVVAVTRLHGTSCINVKYNDIRADASFIIVTDGILACYKANISGALPIVFCKKKRERFTLFLRYNAFEYCIWIGALIASGSIKIKLMSY